MKSIFKLFRPKVLIAGVLLAAAGAFALTLNSNSVLAATCPGKDDDTNAIVRCGFDGKNGFKAMYNKPSDIQGMYADPNFGNNNADGTRDFFGFTAADMDAIMGERGKWGWAHKDGRIILDDGRVLATKGYSSGRENFNEFRKPITLGGKQYYWSYLQHSFKASTTKLRVLVLMDAEDKYMRFAAMDACGNPTTGELPKFNCKMLKGEKVEGSETKFKFTTTVELKNSTVKTLHYDFGDGETLDTTSLTVDHDYKKTGNFKVKVTITYIVNGVETKEKLQIKCQTEVEVKEKIKPSFVCTELKGIVLPGDRKYKFVGKAEFKDANPTKATFDFGDGQTGAGTIKVTATGKAEITSADHQYAEFTGKKVITLDIEFTIGNDKKNVKCQTEISREILPKEECKPQKGEDSNCNKIPETGPSEILGATLGISGLGAAGAYYRASRKNLTSLLDKFKQ